MVLRALVVEDLEAVSALCIAAFTRAVAPSRQRRGIGRALVSAAIERARGRADGQCIAVVGAGLPALGLRMFG